MSGVGLKTVWTGDGGERATPPFLIPFPFPRGWLMNADVVRFRTKPAWNFWVRRETMCSRKIGLASFIRMIVPV